MPPFASMQPWQQPHPCIVFPVAMSHQRLQMDHNPESWDIFMQKLDREPIEPETDPLCPNGFIRDQQLYGEERQSHERAMLYLVIGLLIACHFVLTYLQSLYSFLNFNPLKQGLTVIAAVLFLRYFWQHVRHHFQ